MRATHWIDHVPPWLAFGAIYVSDIYEPWELLAMALPLALAGFVEQRRWSMASWQRPLEILALIAFLALVGARIGLVPTVVITLFLLCGIRLALPRTLPQRRQMLVMGFLAWITTGIASFEFHFLLFALLWVFAAAAALLDQAWETSASLRNGPVLPAPWRRIPLWVAGVILVATVFFAIMPRLTLGFRTYPWGIAGLTLTQAGMDDSLDLGQGGPIAPSGDIVLRIIPPPDLPPDIRAGYAEHLALLRGVSLDVYDHARWDAHPESLSRPFSRAYGPLEARADGRLAAECFVAPSPHGILPLPYGSLELSPPQGVTIRSGPGGSLRWMFPSRRPLPLFFRVAPSATYDEWIPAGPRRALLTDAGTDTEAADRWARKVAPADLSARETATRLTSALRRLTYTLDNPSGRAANPLEDFLERTQAGHCEYFASALALMLRHRNIPSRVVNGYRLGPWIDEGGYWLVTQNEAHSWVEYFDEDARTWQVADPTPPAPSDSLSAGTAWAALQRWTDALRYRWDRHVVRFSDQDQMAAASWIHDRAVRLPDLRPSRQTWIGLACLGAGLLLWSWLRRVFSARRIPFQTAEGTPITALKPLLRRVPREYLPTPGETAQHWFYRLARQRPERRTSLRQLADETDAVAYDDRSDRDLKRLVREEIRAWKRR